MLACNADYFRDGARPSTFFNGAGAPPPARANADASPRRRLAAASAWPQALALIVPGRLETRTGGSIYDRQIAIGLRGRGWTVDVRELEGNFPNPTPADLAAAARVLETIPDGLITLIDGLALGAMPAEIEHEASRLRIVALVHLPLAADVGIDVETADRLEASERRALAGAALVVATGSTTIARLQRYGVERERIVLVEPGTARAPLARGSAAGPLQLLSVATLNPGKGHEILFRALASIPQRDWRLTCAGSFDRHPATVARVREALRADGLADRVSLVGELDEAELSECYDRADLFVLATLHETYGMAVAEAIARGLPVVSTITGAIPYLVDPDGDGAGLLVSPGDADALADTLSRVLGDARLRGRLAEGARRVRDRLPTWDETASRMAAALERIST
jgi:glycosyltransferase involved in cell wall biosynthesis